MRPIVFVFPIRPEHTSRSDSHVYAWKVRLDNGKKERCVVRIPRNVADLAWDEPGLCGPDVVDAVKTHGMSVVEDMVLRHDDPPMNWVVDATDVHADSGWPPE